MKMSTKLFDWVYQKKEHEAVVKPDDCLEEVIGKCKDYNLLRATNYSAGFDIPIDHDVLLPANSYSNKIETGFFIKSKTQNYIKFMIVGRSSVKKVHVKQVSGDIINVMMPLDIFVDNAQDKPVFITKDSVIAQLVPYLASDAVLASRHLVYTDEVYHADILYQEIGDRPSSHYTNFKPITLKNKAKTLLSTQLYLQQKIDKNYALLIQNANVDCGYLKNKNIHIAPGLIDSDYKGNIKVAVWNDNNNNFTLKPYKLGMNMTTLYLDLDPADARDHERTGGFGSTSN